VKHFTLQLPRPWRYHLAMSKTPPVSIALSARLIELGGSVPTEIKLLPSGKFKAKDGRPHGLSGWLMNDQSAGALLSACASQQDNYLIDYDHQTLYSKTNGQQAPAAGWFSALQWRSDDGLYATNVEWTAAATQAIESKEYRYISPVLTFNPSTGEVTGLLMAALVNYPALDGLNDLAAAHFHVSLQQDITMDQDELLERLRYLLNLPTLATLDEVLAELEKLKTLISTPEDTTQGLAAYLSAQTHRIEELSAHLPDVSSFVPVEVMQGEYAALLATVQGDKIRQMIEPALADGRLLPAQKVWAEKLGSTDLAALTTYLDTARPIAALSGLQTNGIGPDDRTISAFKTPTGYSIDPETVALHTKIKNYQSEHNTTYEAAILAVEAQL